MENQKEEFNLEPKVITLPVRTISPPIETLCGQAKRFISVYWKTMFVCIWPLILLPVFVLENIAPFRCMYVVLIMAGFWVTECLPLPVTALIPMVLFPLMGVLDSDRTSLCYLKETNMMFVGGLMIAIAVEHCNLHKRTALWVILKIGCSPRKLIFGLMMVSMFVSMWISNTAAIAMMCPIMEAVLKEMEEQGLGDMYVQPKKKQRKTDDLEADIEEQVDVEEAPRPSNTTICYFLSSAYAVGIGGTGAVVGSGTNLTFKGIYETRFPNSPGIDFTKWMFFNVPGMLIMTVLTWVWLQFLFMGLWRPKTAEAKQVRKGTENQAVATKIIRRKYEEMGGLSFHETCVGLGFILSVMLWFFRKPEFIPGWAERITDHKVKDATAALIVVMLLFILPANLDFLNSFSKNQHLRPKKPSPSLLTWKVVQQKMPWGLLFLLGGGFAIAEGSKETGMSEYIAEYLNGLSALPPLAVVFVTSLVASTLTEFSSNVAIANIILPVLAEMSVALHLHPLYLMLPAALCCSYAFTMPVGTPPNAMVAAAANIRTPDMAKAGMGVSVITLGILMLLFPTWGTFIYPLNTFPDWAANNKTGNLSMFHH